MFWNRLVVGNTESLNTFRVDTNDNCVIASIGVYGVHLYIWKCNHLLTGIRYMVQVVIGKFECLTNLATKWK